MSEKQIHIVFKVLNFIRSLQARQYHLIAFDKLLLIFLANHHGKKGIYVGHPLLASELDVSRRYVKERLSHLKKLGLILVTRKGNRWFYSFEFISSTGELQFPTYVPAGEPQFPKLGNYSSPSWGTVVPHINKDINKDLKTDITHAGRASNLKSDFYPSLEAIEYAQKLGISASDVNEQIVRFKRHYVGENKKRKNWDAQFKTWIDNHVQYNHGNSGKSGNSGKKAEVVRPSIPWANEVLDKAYGKKH